MHLRRLIEFQAARSTKNNSSQIQRLLCVVLEAMSSNSNVNTGVLKGLFPRHLMYPARLPVPGHYMACATEVLKMQTNKHTYIHTCIQTYIHAYIHTCIQTHTIERHRERERDRRGICVYIYIFVSILYVHYIYMYIIVHIILYGYYAHIQID